MHIDSHATSRRRRLAAGFIPALCLGAVTALATPGTLAHRDGLRAEARDDASIIRKLDKGTALEVLARDGAWYRVALGTAPGAQQGWVRLYWVRTAGAHIEQAAAQPMHSISDSIAMARGRRDRGQVAATIGMRGMSEEDLKAAHYDAAQLKKLDGLAVTHEAASKFAAAGPVDARSVDELEGASSGRSKRR